MRDFCVASKIHVQVFGDVLRDLRLKIWHVGKLPLVLLAPHDAIMLGIHKFGADGEIVASLYHAAGEYCVDTKLTGDRGGIDRLTLVTVGRREGNDLEIGELRKGADKVLGDSLAEIFGIRIARGIHDWQDCHGIHGGFFYTLYSEKKGKGQDYGDGKARGKQ